jgi:RNA polymerase sigma-70 factor (ECF subfamily)
MNQSNSTGAGAGVTDQDWVRRAQRGDADAIGQLYDAHHQALFRYVWSRVGERALAEDLTGEVFMRMLSALPRYRETAAPFRAWLYQIARNLLVDHYRQTGNRMNIPLGQVEMVGSAMMDLTTLVEQQLTLERVQQALARLEATQREVVTLRFLSGLSLQEVASVLGKSENAVKALQHRGLATLRQVLAQEQVSHES